jgi:MFS transporter, DHA1 family, multidrug resistance protein
MTRKQYFIIVLILGALSTISPFSIDMYLPGFPAIAESLHTTIDRVGLSLTSYLVGISAGQLLYGPLLDRYGRKNPVYAGLSIYVLASVGCALTTSVNALIFMRFFQAVGGCVGLVASQALVRDIFPATKTAQAFSLLVLVVAVSPMVAPAVGGHVTAVMGWHYVFIILAGITLAIMAAIYFVLPEGKKADASLSLRPKAVLTNFYTVLKKPQFLIYAVTGGIATAGPFAYIVGSPDVFMNMYGLNEKQYGWIFATLAVAMIGSPQFNHVLLRKFKSEQIIKAALLYQSVVGVVLVVGTWLLWYDLYMFLTIMFLFLLGQGLTGPNSTALALAPFTRHAGSAASLLGAFRMGMGGVVSASVSVLHNNTAMPMVGTMVLCSFAGLIILAAGKTTIRYRAGKKEIEEESSVIV